MNDLKNKLLNFMIGRYGTDKLNTFLFGMSIFCIVMSFFGFHAFSKIALIFIILYIFRAFSKNYNQRYNENQIYLKYTEKIRWRIREFKKTMHYRKTHKIFKCPQCKKKLSVPKGKGKLEISCQCGHKFYKKT